jgi:O-antigen/teichoic acid export membrane protein
VSTNHFLLEAKPRSALSKLRVKIGPQTLVRRDSPDTAAVSVMSGLSLRSNFAWVLAGNVIYAACQWGMIVALAKLGNSYMVGQFSLGLAIASPVLMFTNLHLRAVQATDARRLYTFAEYLRLRSVMSLVAIAVVAGIAGFGHYERQTRLVIVAIALAKGIETLSDIYYGLFQLNDRLDKTGVSMILRGVFSVATLSAGLYLTRNIFWACVGLVLVWLASLYLFDLRQGRHFAAISYQHVRSSKWTDWCQPELSGRFQRQWNLMRLALPLGIVTTMVSVNLNLPRYFIEARMGVHQLGIFSALAYATVALTLISDSLGHCAIPRMSRLYAGGQLAEFRSVLLKVSGISSALGLAGLVVAHLMGTRFLTVFYSPEYAADSRVFVVLMLATAIHCVAGMLTAGIMSARCFWVQVPMYVLVVASTALACYRLVPTAGLMGGAEAMVIGAVVRLALAAPVLGYLLLLQASYVAGRQPRPPRIHEWNLSV